MTHWQESDMRAVVVFNGQAYGVLLKGVSLEYGRGRSDLVEIRMEGYVAEFLDPAQWQNPKEKPKQLEDGKTVEAEVVGRRAHSRSEYKRLTAQGVSVLPPKEVGEEE